VLRILDSPGFIRSGRISELLRFLVERSLQEHGDRPKETVLGVEVFGRTPGYDTQADPVVRVTARRLRSKLKQFYQATGRDDPVRMELPPGGYVLKFSFRDQSEEQRPAALALARTLIGPGKALFDHFNGPRLVVEGLRQSTGSGTPSHPVFSPDGHAIAFDWRGPGDAAEGLYVQRLDADGPARFSRSTARELRPAWSPDGGRIAFIREIGEGRFEIRAAPTYGVGDSLLAHIATRPGDVPRIDWSPDGKVLVTSGQMYPEAEDVLLLILLEGRMRQQITVPPSGCWGDDEAVFSPRGNMLAFRRRTGPRTGDVYLHPMTSDGAEHRLTWDECETCGIAWSPDGDSLIVSSRREGDIDNLWRISLSNRPPVRLTETTEVITWPAVSRRGERLAYVRPFMGPVAGEPSALVDQVMVVEDFR
jgi:Tol biopolymer transport system component